MLLQSFALSWPFGESWLYPVFAGAGVAIGLSVASRRLLSDGYSVKSTRRLVLAAFVSLLLGGQFAWLLRHFGEFESPALALVPQAGRIVSWIGLALVAWITLALSRQMGGKAQTTLDSLAPAGVALWLAEKLGAWFAGQDNGVVASASLPWANAYPKGTPVWEQHVRQLGLDSTAEFSHAVHPVQLYSALFAVMALVCLIRWAPVLKSRPGMATGIGLVFLALDDFCFSRMHVGFNGRAFLMFSASEFFALIGASVGFWLISASRPGGSPTAEILPESIEREKWSRSIPEEKRCKGAPQRRDKKNKKRRK